MKNEKIGKYLSIIGRVIAGGLAFLALLRLIPANGLLIWGGIFVCGSMIIIGNRLEQE